KVEQRLNQSNKIRVAKLMQHKVQIQIPTTINVDQPYDTQAYVELAHKLFTKHFSGSSSKVLLGWYQANDFRLVNEQMIEVEVWMTEELLFQYWSEIEDFIFLLLDELKQETVIVVVDSVAVLFEKAESNSVSVMAA
ncbi:MAG: hypothetical protein ACOC0N_10165, partial [Chroococcales cyanobacterium]